MVPPTNDFIAPYLGAMQERSKTCDKEMNMRSQQGVVKMPSEGQYFVGLLLCAGSYFLWNR